MTDIRTLGLGKPLYRAHQELLAEYERLRAEVKALKSLSERLKLEAQIHAQEARTANATIAECYQAVTGGKGEPGNWHGAQPVRDCIDALRAPVARPLSEWHEDMGDVLWWRLPVDEPPYCGQMGDIAWPGYHTHWTPLVVPADAARAAQGERT